MNAIDKKFRCAPKGPLARRLGLFEQWPHLRLACLLICSDACNLRNHSTYFDLFPHANMSTEKVLFDVLHNCCYRKWNQPSR
jgi:hypothetical protein